MTKVRMFKQDGSKTPYFWSSTESKDRTSLTVYKQTEDGVTRMKGVSFNAVTNRMRRD